MSTVKDNHFSILHVRREIVLHEKRKCICAVSEYLLKRSQLLRKELVKAKLLEGVRGKGGGYRLTKAPEQYTVGSILRLTENSMAPVACLEPGSTDCPRMGSCKTLPLWQGLDKVVNEYLDGITIADLVQNGQPGDDYVI